MMEIIYHVFVSVLNLSTEIFVLIMRTMEYRIEKTIYTPEYRTVIAWLIEERKSANLTIRDLAVRLGVVHSYVGRIETFERRLDVYEYVKYCHALGVNPKNGIDILQPDNRS